MKSVRQIAILMTLACAGLALGRGNLSELTVPLRYSPQEGVQEISPDLPPALLRIGVEIRVEDARKGEDRLLIGRGTGGDDRHFPIHAERDPIAFIQETATEMSRDWSLQQERGGPRTLVLQVTRFDIDESNKALGSVYTAEVKLAYVLKDARGNVVAEGMGSGEAHRYGHAHSPDNINEVLSDALKEAYGNVLGDATLQKAWVSTGSSSPSTPSAHAGESAEERLRKLDDLLKKGLITKPEYDRKRAEILKDM